MKPILILAAGQSRRMRGRDKLLEDIDGKPLLRLQAERAIATRHSVFVTLPDLDGSRATVLSGLDIAPIPVPDAKHGVGVSLRTGVRSLPRCDAFMIVLADLVALTTEDLLQVLGAHDTRPGNLIWRGATPDGKPGHPILCDAGLRPAFDSLSGDAGGATILKPLRDRTHLVRFSDNRALLDLDTPEDWVAWRASSPETPD